MIFVRYIFSTFSLGEPKCTKNNLVKSTFVSPNLTSLSLRGITLLHRDVWFVPKVGQIVPKWDKSGTFSEELSMKTDLKKPRICPISGQSDPLLGQIWTPCYYVSVSTVSCDVILYHILHPIQKYLFPLNTTGTETDLKKSQICTFGPIWPNLDDKSWLSCLTIQHSCIYSSWRSCIILLFLFTLVLFEQVPLSTTRHAVPLAYFFIFFKYGKYNT